MKATFTRMDQSTKEDWDIIGREQVRVWKALPDTILEHLRALDDDSGGFGVDRLTHSLQTAARAEDDERDLEYVMCALLHDIGDYLTPYNHPDMAAAILKPFVSDANHWMVAKHGIFQGYYFWHHVGGDRDARDQFAGHDYYELTAEFCAKYDMPAFDPDYPTPGLDRYEPMVREFFQPKYRIDME